MKLVQERLGYAAAVAEEAVQSGTHPSAVIAVADSAKTVWTHLVPGADGAALDSIFLVASISKPIVATAVMQLVEEGRLMLNRPVADYLPEFGAVGKEQVTTWHLLTHTSGLEEQRWLLEAERTPVTSRRLYEFACQSDLHFEPGSRCEYCSLTFNILAELITRLGGLPYPDYLREHILAPLGMRDTAFQPPDTARAMPVQDFGGPERTAAYSALAVPGGGLWSTAADLVAFGQTFLRGGRRDGYRLLGPAALGMMTGLHTSGMTEMVEGRAKAFRYGLGWGKPHPDASLASPSAYGHGGATGTLLWVDPTWDLVFVFLTNRWEVGNDVATRVLNAVYGALEP
ncbi:MAG: serine hydrolase domain-containing protein [Chloroflexia bacterium]